MAEEAVPMVQQEERPEGVSYAGDTPQPQPQPADGLARLLARSRCVCVCVCVFWSFSRSLALAVRVRACVRVCVRAFAHLSAMVARCGYLPLCRRSSRGYLTRRSCRCAGRRWSLRWRRWRRGMRTRGW